LKLPFAGLAALLVLSFPQVAAAQGAPIPKPYVVAVVPGHGGDDPGAVYPPDSSRPAVEEKNLTLPIALKLRDLLEHQAVKVVMTRTSDVTTTGDQRAAIAEKAGANVFVAVHVNSFFADASVRGAEAQFFSDPNLADDVADGLVLSLNTFQETVRTTKDREQDNILSMPGVIVEAGYLSNNTDRDLLQTNGYQDAVAAGIYEGLLKYAPQIGDLKAQIDAFNAAHPTAAPAGPSSSTPRGPGWLALGGIGIGLAAAAGVARRRARRRLARPVVRRYR
jgi:N-acetylmuramoyl-L-alanine amidase